MEEHANTRARMGTRGVVMASTGVVERSECEPRAERGALRNTNAPLVIGTSRFVLCTSSIWLGETGVNGSLSGVPAGQQVVVGAPAAQTRPKTMLFVWVARQSAVSFKIRPISRSREAEFGMEAPERGWWLARQHGIKLARSFQGDTYGVTRRTHSTTFG